MSIHETKPVIDLKYNNEVLETQDKSLKIQQDTKLDTEVVKNGMLFKDWRDGWGTELKPENAKDYWYICYKIEALVSDSIQTNYTLSLKDNLKDNPYNMEIIAYSDIYEAKYPRLPESYALREYLQSNEVKYNKSTVGSKVEWPLQTVTINKNEIKNNSKENENIYVKTDIGGLKYLRLRPTSKYAYVIAKIPAKELGLMDDTKKHDIDFKNYASVSVDLLNSDDGKINKDTSKTINYRHNPPPPKVNFIAPPGNEFSLEKYSRDGIVVASGYNETYKNRGVNYLDPTEGSKEHVRQVHWGISANARVASETYDPSFGYKNNPDAYHRKMLRYEIVDDYLYLGNNYNKELTSEDYEVTHIGFGDTKFYRYGLNTDKTKVDYNYVKTSVKSALYGRSTSTGKWEEIAKFDLSNTGWNGSVEIKNIQSKYKGLEWKYFNISYSNYGKRNEYLNIPEGYSNVKLVFESSDIDGFNINMAVVGKVKPSSKKVMDYINETSENGAYDITIRNDGTFAVYNNSGEMIGVAGTTEVNADIERTLELDKINYGKEMYHGSANFKLIRGKDLQPLRGQELSKHFGWKENNVNEKYFKIPTTVTFREYVKIRSYEDKQNEEEVRRKNFHLQRSGIFYDLLPFGVSSVENIRISGSNYVDKDTGSKNLRATYELTYNWRNSGRTMLIAKFDNAKLNYVDKKSIMLTGPSLEYDMIYPWDSYKDYGEKIRNIVAYESGFERHTDDALDDSLTNELEYGHKDLNPGYSRKYDFSYDSFGRKTKIFTDQEIEWMKDLNPNHDEKRFLYAQASTTVSGDTEANVGLTKHVSTDINPNFTLKSSTKEGGNYQYKIRLQAAHGTNVSNLVFFDSIENYDPLKADEDYGIKQWRGTLSSIDLNHPIMKGIAPKVYVSTKPKLDIEKHNDVSDSSVWKLYKEGDDLSNVQAVAIDLRKNKDGSDFKLEQDTAINVYLNMKAPWNLKEKQIDPKAKALNAIYASNTVTTSLDNKSTKLIYTAYTAVDLKPVTTETQIKATKKHLDKEGKDIALKGDDFKFELRDSNNKVLQTKTNDNKGNITFDPIKYNSWDVGEYTYKIVEVKGDSETTAYDSHEEIVKVKVERSGDSELKATTTYDKDGAAFNNHEVDAITASLEAKKVYIGKGGLEEKPTAGAFEFVLKDAEGKEVAKATNDAEGKVVFEGLEFKPNQIGEHKYTIEEVKGKDTTIEYDNTKKNVTVNVSLTKDFKLKADVVYDKGETPTFTNTLKSVSLQLVKLKEGSKTFTLDEVKDKNGFLTSYKVPEAQKDSVLDGAEYELYKIEADGTEKLVDTLITKNGISQVVQDIMPGKYKLKETKAPKGYTLNDKDLIFDITDKDAGTIVAKFATDDSIIDMPSTGGQGTKALMIGGGILVVAMAGVLVIANKKKKEELNK